MKGTIWTNIRTNEIGKKKVYDSIIVTPCKNKTIVLTVLERYFNEDLNTSGASILTIDDAKELIEELGKAIETAEKEVA